MTVTDLQDRKRARAAAFAFVTLLPAACVEMSRTLLRHRFPRRPRTALGLGAAAGIVVGSLAIGTAFEGP